jgi:hypothetical protein
MDFTEKSYIDILSGYLTTVSDEMVKEYGREQLMI